MNNRYLIFGGSVYYATGGGYEVIESKESKEEAVSRAKELVGKSTLHKHDDDPDEEVFDLPIEWTQVFDVQELKIVYESDLKPHSSGLLFLGVQE